MADRPVETWSKEEILEDSIVSVHFDLAPGCESYRISRDQLLSLLVAAGYTPDEVSTDA